MLKSGARGRKQTWLSDLNWLTLVARRDPRQSNGWQERLQKGTSPLTRHCQCWGQCWAAQQSCLLHMGFSPTRIHSHLGRAKGKFQSKLRGCWDQLMLPSATRRPQRLQSSSGSKIPRGKVKNSWVWLLEAPTLQTLGKNCWKSLKATALQQWGLEAAGESLPPAVPSATAGLQQDMLSKSTGCRPALVLQKPRAQKKEGLIHPLKVATEGKGGHRESQTQETFPKA